MPTFAAMTLPATPTDVAADGSHVRPLLGLAAGGMAHFELAAGKISRAIHHRTVEEIWYIVGGRGRMWRRLHGADAIVDLVPGTCLTIPLGTHFQFRADGSKPLAAIGVTMPPWPGDDKNEVVFVDGCPQWLAEAQD